MKTITKDFEARTAYESPSILVVEMKTATVLCQSAINGVSVRDLEYDYDEDEELGC